MQRYALDHATALAWEPVLARLSPGDPVGGRGGGGPVRLVGPASPSLLDRVEDVVGEPLPAAYGFFMSQVSDGLGPSQVVLHDLRRTFGGGVAGVFDPEPCEQHNRLVERALWLADYEERGAADRRRALWDRIIHLRGLAIGGTVPIGEMGCAIEARLVVRGAHKGLILADETANCGPIRPFTESAHRICFADFGNYLPWAVAFVDRDPGPPGGYLEDVR